MSWIRTIRCIRRWIFWILAITMTTISGVCSQMISARHGGDSGAGGCSERLGGILLVLTECLLIGSAYTGYELKQGQTEYTTIQRALLRMRSQGIFLEDQELPADTQIRVERHQEAVFEMPDTEPDGQQISAGPEPLLQAGPEKTGE